MNAFAIPILGGITIISIWGQWKIIEKEQSTNRPIRRILFPIWFSIVIFLGILSYGLVASADGYVNGLGSSAEWRALLFRSIGFGIVLVFQSYFSAVVCGYVFASLVFKAVFADGGAKFAPLIIGLAEWAFPGAPPWFGDLYTVLVSFYVFITSMGNFFDWDFEFK